MFFPWLVPSTPIMGPEPVTRASLELKSSTQMKSSSEKSDHSLSLSSPCGHDRPGSRLTGRLVRSQLWMILAGITEASSWWQMSQ